MPNTQNTSAPRALEVITADVETNATKTAPNRRVLIIVSLIAIISIGLIGRMWWRSQNLVETDNAFIAGHVHPLSSRISGVVTKVLVEDNQLVREGDVIAELDPADQRAKVEQIEAQIASAGQQVLQADAQLAQVRAQASATQAQVGQSEAQLQRAKQDAERSGQLYNTQMKAVSKAELDSANTTRAAAQADLSARHDAALAAQAQIIVASSAREVTKAQIKVLQVQLKDANQQLAYNRILAPVAGRLGKRNVEVGTRVQAGQQLGAIVEDNVWLVANFKETQLAELRQGQEVKVVIDAMPNQPLIGKLDSFSPASGAQFALLPADNATGNFTKIVQRVPVKIVLRAEDLKQFAGRLVPGMSALAEVHLHQDQSHADVSSSKTSAAK